MGSGRGASEGTAQRDEMYTLSSVASKGWRSWLRPGDFARRVGRHRWTMEGAQDVLLDHRLPYSSISTLNHAHRVMLDEGGGGARTHTTTNNRLGNSKH